MNAYACQGTQVSKSAKSEAYMCIGVHAYPVSACMVGAFKVVCFSWFEVVCFSCFEVVCFLCVVCASCCFSSVKSPASPPSPPSPPKRLVTAPRGPSKFDNEPL